jgi:hypothetical protein
VPREPLEPRLLHEREVRGVVDVAERIHVGEAQAEPGRVNVNARGGHVGEANQRQL